MKAREFYDTVMLMRRAQKQYFATRSKEALNESKMYEQRIDAEIERVTAILDKLKKQ
jgi:hypothetical protein